MLDKIENGDRGPDPIVDLDTFNKPEKRSNDSETTDSPRRRLKKRYGLDQRRRQFTQLFRFEDLAKVKSNIEAANDILESDESVHLEVLCGDKKVKIDEHNGLSISGFNQVNPAGEVSPVIYGGYTDGLGPCTTKTLSANAVALVPQQGYKAQSTLGYIVLCDIMFADSNYIPQPGSAGKYSHKLSLYGLDRRSVKTFLAEGIDHKPFMNFVQRWSQPEFTFVHELFHVVSNNIGDHGYTYDYCTNGLDKGRALYNADSYALLVTTWWLGNLRTPFDWVEDGDMSEWAALPPIEGVKDWSMGVIDRKSLTAPPDDSWQWALAVLKDKELQIQVDNPWWDWTAPKPFGAALNNRFDTVARNAFNAANGIISRGKAQLPPATANIYKLACAQAAVELAIQGEIKYNVALSLTNILPLLIQHGHVVSGAVTGVVTYNSLLYKYKYYQQPTVIFGSLVGAQVTRILDQRGRKNALQSGVQAGFAAAAATHEGGFPVEAAMPAALAAADIMLLQHIPPAFLPMALQLGGQQAAMHYHMFRTSTTMTAQNAERAAVVAGVQAAKAYARHGQFPAAHAAANQAAIHATRGEPEATYEAAGFAAGWAQSQNMQQSNLLWVVNYAISVAQNNADNPYRDATIVAATGLAMDKIEIPLSTVSMEDAKKCLDGLLDSNAVYGPNSEMARISSLAVAKAYNNYHEAGDDQNWRVACKSAVITWFGWPGDPDIAKIVELGAQFGVTIFRYLKGMGVPPNAARDISAKARGFAMNMYKKNGYTVELSTIAAKAAAVALLDHNTQEAAVAGGKIAADFKKDRETYEDQQAVLGGRVAAELFDLWRGVPASLRATKDRDVLLKTATRAALQIVKFKWKPEAIRTAGRIALVALIIDMSEETAKKISTNGAVKVDGNSDMKAVVSYIQHGVGGSDKPPGGWGNFIKGLGIQGEDDWEDSDSDDD